MDSDVALISERFLSVLKSFVRFGRTCDEVSKKFLLALDAILCICKQELGTLQSLRQSHCTEADKNSIVFSPSSFGFERKPQKSPHTSVAIIAQKY
ncbi:hypothetical protein AVEN_114471-1 [Araneus ventricosus]|uniref:Uncharacterized protein n=1 Tax=Araneus ventricosus TaxID=182803 RepID=A0A4Y2AHF5_ARAVE|nr:hypothetical protein AVEN_162669-1 [Araneus ventricosus]GBL79027.1 hypothetical protein AVEN_18999-1 [Araneus ventricosus]GBL79047.1 hypothetical protein AVEN_95321-1 [Araneus ventricosus]GBL79052.1 hypothetical protein AVEN_114471-1 [Araneus ventricosus]